jgi:hypothetical protein
VGGPAGAANRAAATAGDVVLGLHPACDCACLNYTGRDQQGERGAPPTRTLPLHQPPSRAGAGRQSGGCPLHRSCRPALLSPALASPAAASGPLPPASWAQPTTSPAPRSPGAPPPLRLPPQPPPVMPRRRHQSSCHLTDAALLVRLGFLDPCRASFGAQGLIPTNYNLSTPAETDCDGDPFDAAAVQPLAPQLACAAPSFQGAPPLPKLTCRSCSSPSRCRPGPLLAAGRTDASRPLAAAPSPCRTRRAFLPLLQRRTRPCGPPSGPSGAPAPTSPPRPPTSSSWRPPRSSTAST